MSSSSAALAGKRKGVNAPAPSGKRQRKQKKKRWTKAALKDYIDCSWNDAEYDSDDDLDDLFKIAVTEAAKGHIGEAVEAFAKGGPDKIEQELEIFRSLVQAHRAQLAVKKRKEMRLEEKAKACATCVPKQAWIDTHPGFFMGCAMRRYQIRRCKHSS